MASTWTTRSCGWETSSPRCLPARPGLQQLPGGRAGGLSYPRRRSSPALESERLAPEGSLRSSGSRPFPFAVSASAVSASVSVRAGGRVAVSVDARGRPPRFGRCRRPHREQGVEQLERRRRIAPHGDDARGIVPGAFVQAERRLQAAVNGDSQSHTRPRQSIPGGAVAQVGARLLETKVAARGGHVAVAARADYPRRIGGEELALDVGGAIVPSTKKRANHRADATRPVAEPLLREHRGQLDDADALLRGGVRAGGEPDRHGSRRRRARAPVSPRSHGVRAAC